MSLGICFYTRGERFILSLSLCVCVFLFLSCWAFCLNGMREIEALLFYDCFPHGCTHVWHKVHSLHPPSALDRVVFFLVYLYFLLQLCTHPTLNVHTTFTLPLSSPRSYTQNHKIDYTFASPTHSFARLL